MAAMAKIMGSKNAMNDRHPSTVNLLGFFSNAHLREDLQRIVKPFAVLAETVADGPSNAETSTCLRKLLEAKDCAVRAYISGQGFTVNDEKPLPDGSGAHIAS